MNNLRKNQIVVVALVVMIVVAGYLNHRSQVKLEAEKSQAQADSSYLESNDDLEDGLLTPESVDPTAEDPSSQEEDTEEANQETLDTETADAVETSADSSPGEAVFVESDAVVPEYFAEAKVERENARAKSQDMLYELMANTDTPEDQKSEAAQEIIDLQKRIENEAAAEAMIKAKGFDNAFVRIYDDSVDVIVDREEISKQEAAQIQDIVTRVTGVSAGNIRISLLKIGTPSDSE